MRSYFFAVGLLLFPLGSMALSSGDSFPEFDLKSLDGRENFTNKNFADTYVLYDFWASWCVPCKEALPFYDEVLKKAAKIQDKKAKLKVLGVNVDDVASAGSEFLKKIGTSFPHAFDEGMVLTGKVETSIMPTSVLVAPDGKVLKIKKGFRSKDKAKLEKELLDLVRTGTYSE